MSLTRTRSGLFKPSLVMPADQIINNAYRKYAYDPGRANWLDMSIKLLANPSGRAAEWAKTTAHIMIQTPELPLGSPMVNAVQAMANLQALTPAMPCYPAFAIFPNNISFDNWFSAAYWVTQAARLHACALIRVPGDLRIGIDAESYSFGGTPGGSTEPTVDSIVAYNLLYGTTWTPAQLRIAMQPFIDQLIADNVCAIGMYPVIFGSPNSIPLFSAYIIQALGPDRCALWWENTFLLWKTYRENLSINGYFGAVNNQHKEEAECTRTLREVYGVLTPPQYVPTSDEDEMRVWGKLLSPSVSPPSAADPSNSLGSVRWYFDTTRFSNTIGQSTFPSGLDISPLNGVDTAIFVRPLMGSTAGGGQATSVGNRATPISTEFWAGAAATEVLSPSALVNVSIVGLQIPLPVGGGNTWCGMRIPNALPALNTDAWTHKLLDITIPASISADTPLWFIGQNNVCIAVLYYLQASDKIVLLVSASGVNSYDVLLAPARDTAHRIVIGRNGTTWRHSANGAASVDRVTPTQAGVFRSPTYGMGCATSMINNTQGPGTGIIFDDQALTYIDQTIAGIFVPGFRSAAEFAQMSNRTAGATNNYPFNWFT